MSGLIVNDRPSSHVPTCNSAGTVDRRISGENVSCGLDIDEREFRSSTRRRPNSSPRIGRRRLSCTVNVSRAGIDKRWWSTCDRAARQLSGTSLISVSFCASPRSPRVNNSRIAARLSRWSHESFSRILSTRRELVRATIRPRAAHRYRDEAHRAPQPTPRNVGDRRIVGRALEQPKLRKAALEKIDVKARLNVAVDRPQSVQVILERHRGDVTGPNRGAANLAAFAY